MNRKTLAGLILTIGFCVCATGYGRGRARGVKAWQVPAKADPAKREGWKAATKDAAISGGLALENKYLVLITKPGALEATVYAKNKKGKATQISLAFKSKTGAAAKIEKVELKDLQTGAGTLRVTVNGIQTDITLKRRQSILTVQPTKPGGFLEVQASSRYAVLPDFSSQDAVYDPLRIKGETLSVPAKNFILNYLDGNDSAVMCLWPGALAGFDAKKGKAGKPPAKPIGRAPTVKLILGGKAEARRLVGTQIECLIDPIYVSILQQENLWHAQDLKGKKAGDTVKVGWKPPFNAQWRANLLAVDGTKKKNLFLMLQKKAQADEGAWSTAEGTFLKLPRASSYDRALIYALDRVEDTPLSVYTPIDILRQTLGMGPCEYILDLKDAKANAKPEKTDASKKGETKKPAPKKGKGAATGKMVPDTPEQAELRKQLKDQGYLYLPHDNKLSRINADGSGRIVLKEFAFRDRAFWCQASWDGKYVGVVVTLRGNGNGQELWLMKHDGSDAKMIMKKKVIRSWFSKLYCAWTADSKWLVISHGLKVEAIHRETLEKKLVITVKEGKRKAGIANLSSDRQGNFYYWGMKETGGDAFSLDNNCKVTKPIHTSGMVTVCQPKVSPDGLKMVRHDHDYKWNSGNKRGYISEKPKEGEKKSTCKYFFPKNAAMPYHGTHDNPFWSPDGKYMAFVYHPRKDLLTKDGFTPPKHYAVITICSMSGGPMVWITPQLASFPSWGPVPN